MYPYLSIYLVATLLAFAARSRQQSMLLAGVFSLAMALFAGTRIWVGCDYFGYLMRFQGIGQFPGWTEFLSEGEPVERSFCKPLLKASHPHQTQYH